MKIQFLFQRHNFNVTDLLLETLEQKVVTFFLCRFNKNRVREQLDDMRTPVNRQTLTTNYEMLLLFICGIINFCDRF